MRKKKLVSLLLASAMAMTMLVGCGGDDEKETTAASSSNNGDGTTAETVEDVALKVWVPEEEMDLTKELCEAFDAAYSQFNCTFEYAVIGIDESAGQLSNDPELAADVFMLPSGSVAGLVKSGLLYPITAELDTVNSLYAEAALDSCSNDGKLYGIPFTANTFFMYYNKDMYTEEEVQSLETMMAKDFGEGKYNFSIKLQDSWYLESFFLGAGCTLYGADGTDPTECSWNNDLGIAAGEYVIDLVNNPKFINEKDGIAFSLMKDEKLGAMCTGAWDENGLKEVLGDKLGACALPTIKINGEDKRLSNFVDYKMFAVKSTTKHPLAAQLLVEWLANEESQLKRMPVSQCTPTCISLADNEALKDSVAAIGLMDQTKYSTQQPAISQIDKYWTPVAALGEGILSGEVTKSNLKENLDTVVATVTEIDE